MPGVIHRIPFRLTRADISVDAILLAPAPQRIEFLLESPSGRIVKPADAGVEPAIQFVSTPRVSYYRTSLPMLKADPVTSDSGEWHVLLSIRGRGGKTKSEYAIASRTGSIPYSLLVQARSNLEFRASVLQKSFEPGATAAIEATLSQYDVPLDHRATAWAEITRPDGSGVHGRPKRIATGAILRLTRHLSSRCLHGAYPCRGFHV